MKYEYSENVLVQDSAAALMHDELGWDVVFAYNQEVLGDNGTLGRKDFLAGRITMKLSCGDILIRL